MIGEGKMTNLLEIFFLPLACFAMLTLAEEKSECTPESTARLNNTDLYYQVLSKNFSCNLNLFEISVELNRPFNGIIYARGYPKIRAEHSEKKCYGMGDGTGIVNIPLKTTACGVRISPINDETAAFSVRLVVQSDKYLQQRTNFEIQAMCLISTSEFSEDSQERQKARSGRKLQQQLSSREKSILKTVRPWMDLHGTRGSSVAVGDTIRLYVKTLRPAYLAAAVTSCTAYDGLRERSQPLSDSKGCSLDEALVPTIKDVKEVDYATRNEWESYPGIVNPPRLTALIPSLGRGYDISANGAHDLRTVLQVSGVNFPAFKFPDAANLHIKCELLICRFHCPGAPCNASRREAREVPGAVVLDKLDVFNSIRVVAPGLDASTYEIEKEAAIQAYNKICMPAHWVLTVMISTGTMLMVILLIICCAVIHNFYPQFLQDENGSIIFLHRRRFVNKRNRMALNNILNLT